MSDPNSLEFVIQELNHLHGDIKQLGCILIFLIAFMVFFRK